MSYILLGDNCDSCRYVTNAFSLLRLPLATPSIEEFTHATDAIAAIVCKSIENKLKKQIHTWANTHAISLITFNEQSNFHSELQHPPFLLKMPFSLYELESALSHSANRKNDVPDFIEEQ